MLEWAQRRTVTISAREMKLVFEGIRGNLCVIDLVQCMTLIKRECVCPIGTLFHRDQGFSEIYSCD